MHLLSTAKKTLLSDFADLETKSSYEHSKGESTDFQFSAQKRIFVEVNRKSGLEVLRVKGKENNSYEIQRIRKLNIDNVYCVACAKQTVEEIAVGMSSGHVKIYNYQTAQMLHRFASETPRKTVLSLDYNSTDEYLASVLESGDINIYGIKTSNKLETVQFDANSTLARFHPAKRFQLAIASHKGAVTLYDIQTKRKLYNASEAHKAPCRDLCMSASNPATLISVGYDCVINIFDIRRKSHPANGIISYSHPLSAVALSDCGTYFCAGNLKGELITYDIRNTRNYLAARKVHEGPVVRIAFVPTPEGQGGNSFASSGNATVDTLTGVNTGTADVTANADTQPSSELMRRTITMNLVGGDAGGGGIGYGITTPAATRGARDSFCDFLDAQSNKALDRMSTRLTLRRDSFDWEALTRKTSNEEIRSSIYQVGSGLSSIDSAENSEVESSTSKTSLNSSQAQIAPLRERNGNSSQQLNGSSSGKLVPIEEVKVEDTTTSDEDASLLSDKENPPQRVEQPLPARLRILPSNRNSTPHVVRQSSEGMPPPVVGTQPTALDLPKSASTLSSISSGSLGNELLKEFAELRAHFDARLKDVEIELKLLAEANKWQQFTQIANFWSAQSEYAEEVRDSLMLLLQKDECINELMRLQHENRMLREQLARLKEQE